MPSQILQEGQGIAVLNPYFYTADLYTKLVGPAVPYQGNLGDWAAFVPGWDRAYDTVNGMTLTTRMPWTAIPGEQRDVLDYLPTGGGGVSAAIDFRTPTSKLMDRFSSRKKVAVAAKAQVQSLAISVGATTAGNVPVTLNGVIVNVPVLAADTPTVVSTKIRAAVYAGWTTGGTGTTITFTATDTLVKLAASFDGGTTGVVGAMSTTVPATGAYTTGHYDRTIRPRMMLGWEGMIAGGTLYPVDTMVRGFIFSAQKTDDAVMNARFTGADGAIHMVAALEATVSQVTDAMLLGTGIARTELDPSGKYTDFEIPMP